MMHQETAKSMGLSIKLDLQQLTVLELQAMPHEGKLISPHRQKGEDCHMRYQDNAC